MTQDATPADDGADTAAAGPLAVELAGITKRFPGVVANSDINITVRRGTVHALVGENGAGKSTLMKTLYGMHQPDEGTITVNGKPGDVPLAGRRDRRRNRHGAPALHARRQPDRLGEHRSRLRADGRRPAGRQAGAAAKIDELAKRYGLMVDTGALVEELGVGARQRVEILKVLYRGAQILILDEPTAVLVPQEVDELFGNLRELKSEGLTIIFISHKLDEVRGIADEITVIRRGHHGRHRRSEGGDQPAARRDDGRLGAAGPGAARVDRHRSGGAATGRRSGWPGPSWAAATCCPTSTC